MPAAPFIGATAVSPDGEVLLSWFNLEEDDSITGYQILRGPDADSLAIIEDDTGSNGTSYTDATPPAGQTHTYAVKARNPAGLSPLSNTLTATVPEPEPEEELVTSRQNSEEILVSNHGGHLGHEEIYLRTTGQHRPLSLARASPASATTSRESAFP